MKKKYTNFLFISSIIYAFNVHSQLTTVYAEGGVDKINWGEEIQKTIDNPDENPFLYGSGCTESPSWSNSSSNMKTQGSTSYTSKNVYDWDPRTAWVEGKDDYGIGEYFEVNLPYGGFSVTIFNGYQKSYEAWRNNSRVKKLKVYGGTEPLCYVELTDKMGYQTFEIPSENIYESYRFEIVEVYPGLKWKDVAISEITNLGCCFNNNSTIILNSNNLPIQDFTEGEMISTVDIKTNEVLNSTIIKTAKQTHKTLLRLKAGEKSIELTPFHPLYVKNYGLISLGNLVKSKKFSSFKELENQIELLVWNQELQMCEYVQLGSIELITGTFETHSILKTETGTNYIVNGFITSTY